MTEERTGVSSRPGCRHAEPGAAAVDCCPALDLVESEEGSAEYLGEAVSALLGCRAFLWDVLLDGDWTGCAAVKLKALSALYGWEKVCDAFEEE